MKEKQEHLKFNKQVNLGSFYTPQKIVDLTYNILLKNVNSFEDYTILDSSCGYGSFLNNKNIKLKFIGADIDNLAIKKAKELNNDPTYINCNSLKNVSRNLYKIKDNEKTIIIGNPPYNDTTSIIRQNIKDKSLNNNIDSDIKTRDLGMSFLLSYNKLNVDYVCVLHPLSYLIKQTNFNLIKKFTNNYKLIDGMIISSHEFCGTSKGMAFPILIALYKKDNNGMNYEYIKNYNFITNENKMFKISDFDIISHYITKYPNKNFIENEEEIIAKFYTMRDINALKRNKTFINTEYNAIYITKDKLPFYCYIDVFKKHCDKIPYYFGNLDVFIKLDEFEKIKDLFIYESLKDKKDILKKLNIKIPKYEKKEIEKYFNKLLGEHYV